ncbi:hypothetical protein CIL05_13800 [Virgibacillus profundi]|uniref:DUF4190 domain-containing protein n=1 Tax=Virgibacillus profundi TaxID=2024555 RepID=A0A2A2IBE5_9BACI|nr:hypothetical protein [Virgibacillus profundi]PAV29049.1 hypothetical protein CIL05_13800 [Virgibacillus profundi]PXY53218.1 hypothetical protein CIT14_13925 [Virgibacillus profundi]
MDEFQRYKNKEIEEPPNHGEQKRNKDFVGVEPDSSRNEEFAAELTADDYDEVLNQEDTDVNSTFGWIGLALSVVSFFMMPIILGAAGIILGFVSRSRGADTLGNIAIAAGAISIIIRLFILPFV